MKEYFIEWLQQGNITIPSLLLSSYSEMGLNESELVLLFHVYDFHEKGNHFPTPNEISARMSMSDTECSEMLHKLIQKGFISIKEEYQEDGIRNEKYSLHPLMEKLADYFLIKKKSESRRKVQEEETDIYTTFEKEFGRPLSPMECETLALWLDDDGHDPIIIKTALREAVISGKLNFRYIDRILFEWKKNGIKTIEQAKSYGKRFRPYQHQTQPGKKDMSRSGSNTEKVPFYNWLEQ